MKKVKDKLTNLFLKDIKERMRNKDNFIFMIDEADSPKGRECEFIAREMNRILKEGKSLKGR